MARHNNKADMTVCEQIEAIKEKICKVYCQFPVIGKEAIGDPDEAQEWLKDNFCNNCPLKEL